MSKLGAGKLGAAVLAALIVGIGVAAIAAIVSAHSYDGYGEYEHRGMGHGFGYGIDYGISYGMPLMGYGMGLDRTGVMPSSMPMTGYRMMDYGYQEESYQKDNQEFNKQTRELKEVTGNVIAVYSMSVKLDNGYYIRMPWWFAEEIGIAKNAEVRAKGFQSGGVIPAIIPTYIEVNGQAFGDESSMLPVWMQGLAEEYGDHGYGYGFGYHCPMMGW